MSLEKLITLKTNDGEEFKLDEAIVVRSQVIKHIVQDIDCASDPIPLYNVDGKTMTKVIEYWKKHAEEGVSEDQLKDVLKVHHLPVMYDILMAAHYLGDEELMDVMTQEVTDRIKEKTLEEFGFKNEEEEIHEEMLRLYLA